MGRAYFFFVQIAMKRPVYYVRPKPTFPNGVYHVYPIIHGVAKKKDDTFAQGVVAPSLGALFEA